MNNLPNLIRSEMDEQGLTYRQVSESASRKGYSIGHSVVYDYAKGKTRRYKRDQLTAIAAGLGVPAERLIDAAQLPREAEPFELPEGSEILTPEERAAIRGVVQTMIETRRQVGHNVRDTSISEAGGTPADELEERRKDRGVTRRHTPPWEEQKPAATEGPEDTPRSDTDIEDP